MSTIQAIKIELAKVQRAQARCISESGIIKNCMRYRYQLLVQEATHLKASIDWLESQTSCI